MPEEIDIDGNATLVLTSEEMGSLGLVQEVNRLLLHPVGLAMARYDDGTLRILTDPDPEGWQFAGLDLLERAERFAGLQREWHARRLAALGFVIQPLLDADGLPISWRPAGTDLTCGSCGRLLGVATHIVSGVYCDSSCLARSQEGKRPVRDRPQA